MTPLAEHEDEKIIIISNLIEILLEELNIESRNLGSTTFKNQDMESAVEPDACFYIKNEFAVRGKRKIDLSTDPPPFGYLQKPLCVYAVAHGGNPQDRAVSPDLALEIDITSRTKFGNYEALKVSELWRYNGRQLEINILQNGKYINVQQSFIFRQFPLINVIPQYIEQSKIAGRNTTLKAFRHWVQAQKQNY